MKLYSVITIVRGWPSEESQKSGGTRTVIICTTFENAEEVVLKNVGYIFETSYTYAVIVEFEADTLYGVGFEADKLYGGLSASNKEVWYRWVGNSETGKYIPCDKPEEYKNTIFSF